MSILFQDGDFTQASPTGLRRFSYPFEADNRSCTFDQDFVQYEAHRAPLSLDAADPDQPGFHLVKETDPQDIGGGVVRWTRRFAQVPASRRDYESFAFTFPGLATVSGPSSVFIASASTSAGATVLACGTPPSMAVGDAVAVVYTVQDAIAPNVGYHRTALRTVLAVSGSTVSVGVISEPQPIWSWSHLFLYDPGRDPITYTVGSFVQRDFFLPGVSVGIGDPLDIPILSLDLILDAGGKQVDSYTTDTIPDRASYKARIAAGEWIVAEHSSVRRWMGNIYERATRYVRAI